MKRLLGLLTALGFLSRLAPARLVRPEELGAALGWFPVVGLILGLLAGRGGGGGPWYFGLLQGHPLVQAWIVVGLIFFLTRGLHWDGLADLSDAWGSGAVGEEFWTVLKDSRSGAFGVMGLVLGMAGQIVLLHECLKVGAYGVVVWSLVLGRAVCVGLAFSGRSLARPGLAKAFLGAARPGACVAALALSLVFGLVLVPWPGLVVSCVLAVAVVAALDRLARKQGGLNGDFLGAAVVLGEIAALLGWLAAGYVPMS